MAPRVLVRMDVDMMYRILTWRSELGHRVCRHQIDSCIFNRWSFFCGNILSCSCDVLTNYNHVFDLSHPAGVIQCRTVVKLLSLYIIYSLVLLVFHFLSTLLPIQPSFTILCIVTKINKSSCNTTYNLICGNILQLLVYSIAKQSKLIQDTIAFRKLPTESHHCFNLSALASKFKFLTTW